MSTPASTPKTVLLIRHGEKPDDDTDPNLSAKGWARACAITDTLPALVPKGADPIAAVVATAPSANSVRPIETVTPITLIRGLPFAHTIADDDVAAVPALLAQPPYAGATVLVCWHHGMLPKLALALGAPPADVPAKWEGDDFHTVWILTHHADGKVDFTVTRQPHL
ncbi:hypothetical protein M2352_002582 [Azospirillum fermentarium]|uniref:histidine phosphatase family protein n=1 Tax=Azospirillum fermentarium TaxID=1233114 RepID=UPI00222755FC|nr:histidine phosphatase family protein [Azospirillum fermentarium]MCW2246991.1 hypothetical protein [Azospirillum fermentarium]